MLLRPDCRTATALLVSALALGACASSPVSVPEITSRATLNWQEATIGLPIDAFAMSPSQTNTVQAAQQIVFARCILGSGPIPDSTIRSAGATLGTVVAPNRWVYGYWDMGFISAHGTGSPWGSYSVGQGLTFSDEQLKACVYSEEYMSLDIIDGHTVTASVSEGHDAGGLLMDISMSAYGQTLDDSRFKELAQTRADCVTARGYAIDPDSSYQGVGIQDGWGVEQTLKAALVEAQCGDGMDFTQQAADINATYQQALIDRHEAELVAIQRLVEDRVARATAILQDVGVM